MSRSTWTTVVPVADERAVAQRPHVQRAAPPDEQVGVADQLGGDRRGEAAADVEVERVAAEQPARDRRGGEQRARCASASARSGSRAAARAAPGQEHRAARAREQVGQPPRPPPAAATGAGRRGRRRRPRPGPVYSAACTSSGSPSTTVRRSATAVRQARASVGHRRRGGVQPLGHRADGRGQRGLVDAEVRAHRGAGGLGGQHQQRRAALGGLGDAGQRVGQAGPLVHRQHADAAGGTGEGVGHRRRAALVPGRDEPRAAGDERVGDVEVAAADDAEHRADAEPGERGADRLGDDQRSTRARTRAGLPEPPTIGSGEAITTAPRGRQPVEVAQLREPVLARAEQERVARERRVEPGRAARVGADGLHAEPDDRRLLGEPARALGGDAGRVGAALVGVEELLLVGRARVPAGAVEQPAAVGQRAVGLRPVAYVVDLQQEVGVGGDPVGDVEHDGGARPAAAARPGRRPRRRGR